MKKVYEEASIEIEKRVVEQNVGSEKDEDGEPGETRGGRIE